MLKDYRIIGYDFEVFSKAKWWCVTFKFHDTKEIVTIINDKENLKKFYQENKDNIFVGYNCRGYDGVILKGLLLNRDIFKMSDEIIYNDKKPHQLLRGVKNLQFYNYDISNKMHSLKQLEAFMGDDIRETEVSFELDRELTQEEVDLVVKYNIHDVNETLRVFDYKRETFDSKLLLIETFDLDMKHFERTDAQLSAIILGAVKQSVIPDELDFRLADCIKLDKYKYVYDWYMNPRNRTTGRKLETVIADNPTIFAWGGVHGAKNNIYKEGYIVTFDVASLYPSLMINFDLVSRNVPNPQAFADIKTKRLELKKKKDKKEKALKLVINTTYGTMNDEHNPMNDPNSANSVCVNGQLLLLDVVEKVEHLGEVLQINTDGVYMLVDTLEKIEELKIICKEWEIRTGLELEFEVCSKLYQRDVNNYILISEDGSYKSKGEVKKRTPTDNDLPIVAEALVNYCVNNKSVEDTINECQELIKFQKVVKLTRDYPHALYGEEKQNGKVFRVFASNSESAQGLFKFKKDGSIAKFGNTPEKCFVWNDSVIGVEVPEYLDKSWYIERAKEKLSDFLGGGEEVDEKKSSQDILIEVLNKNHKTLFDLLVDIKQNTKLTKSVLDKFIKVGAFQSYCKGVKASRYVNLFMDLYSKEGKGGKGTSYKKILNDEEFEFLTKFAEYNSEKDSFKAIRILDFLKELFYKIEDLDFKTIDKLRLELDLFDDCSILDENYSEYELFILNVNHTKIPSVIGYSAKYGISNFFKIHKEQFEILEVKVGDLIKVKSFDKFGKTVVLGKDYSGINIVGNSNKEFDWWIKGYEVLNRDYGKNKKLSEIEE